ncbi:hypothetical protein ACHAP5_004025 [Fusarium lateritium]
MSEPAEAVQSTASRPISSSTGDIEATVTTVKWRTEALLSSLETCEGFREEDELSENKFFAMVDVRRKLESLLLSIINVQEQGIMAPAIAYITIQLDTISTTMLPYDLYPEIRGLVDVIDFVFGKSSMAKLLEGTDCDESSEPESEADSGNCLHISLK